MDARQFFDLVANMRDAQKRYFSSRRTIDFHASKTFEDMVDKEIARVQGILAQREQPAKPERPRATRCRECAHYDASDRWCILHDAEYEPNFKCDDCK